jgi:hypothetical protein
MDKLTPKKDVRSVKLFKEHLDLLTEFGYDTFDLTPTIGDVFDDVSSMEIFTILEKDPRVKRFEFVTNFISLTERDIQKIARMKKCECAISIYGRDQDEYEYITNRRNPWDKFLYNLKIVSTINDASSFMIYMRCCKYEQIEGSEVGRLINRMIKNGAKLENAETVNRNWGGLVESEGSSEKIGLCSRILDENGVKPNGDITACCCWDWNDELIIGNANDLKTTYSENGRFAELAWNQLKGRYEGPCVSCDDFSPVQKENLQIPWTKKIEILQDLLMNKSRLSWISH